MTPFGVYFRKFDLINNALAGAVFPEWGEDYQFEIMRQQRLNKNSIVTDSHKSEELRSYSISNTRRLQMI